MILVDTSVWIDFFNDKDTKQVQSLDLILSSDFILVGDLILSEVLQGFRADPDFQIARSYFERLPIVELAGKEISIQSAMNFRTLQKKGITVRKTIDCIIATYCIFHCLPLLHHDRDFDIFAENLGLEIVQ